MELVPSAFRQKSLLSSLSMVFEWCDLFHCTMCLVLFARGAIFLFICASAVTVGEQLCASPGAQREMADVVLVDDVVSPPLLLYQLRRLSKEH